MSERGRMANGYRTGRGMPRRGMRRDISGQVPFKIDILITRLLMSEYNWDFE